ncbi:MAG: hypothetical protein IT423_14445 [Pirellulaceae bacterium]|nr:hypothetical protein [Pirellulaceae bacterium]
MIKHQLSTFGMICVSLLFFAAISPALMAAEKYTIGEEVEVHFLGGWIPATVRDFNKKGEVLGEFEFANNIKQQVFAPDQVRHLYEAGAITRSRTWSDATGKFNVKAALLKISGGKVQLRTSESKEVLIPIDKLSSKDQAFIKQFQAKAGLVAIPVPQLPSVIEFTSAGAKSIPGSGRRWDAREDAATGKVSLNLEADPIRKGLELKQAGVGFPSQGHHERLSSLIPLGGPDNWVLASIGENEREPTRLMWVALNKQSIKRIQMLPAGEMLMDYQAHSRQMLTYSKRKISEEAKDLQPVLTIWQAEPASEEPKAIVSWNARVPDDTSWHNSVPWVRFATGSLVVQRTETHRILAWDTQARSLSWQTTQESFFAPEPRLSAGNKYLFLPEEGGLRILDSATGTVAGQVPMDGCAGVAVHDGGHQIGAISRDRIYVIDITGSQPTRTVAANSVSSPFGIKCHWVGDELLAFESAGSDMVLYSLDLELPIWTFKFDHNAYMGTTGNGARKRSIINDHLIYAASFSVSGNTGLAVGAVSLPGAKATAAIGSAKRDDFMIIKAGTKFRVDVAAIDHASEIRQALLKEISANGWIHDQTAANVIKADYGRGEPREIRYELQSIRTGSTEIQSASITPFVAKVQILVGKDEAWSTLSSSGPPPIVSMREGESLQSEIDRSNRPVWSFYQSLDIPAEIIDPKKRGGVGHTAVTNKGLVDG